MKNMQFATLIFLSLILGLLASTAFADHGHRSINYNFNNILRHSHDLKFVAEALRLEIRDHFRPSYDYGRMLTLSSKIRTHARRLHSHAAAHRIYELEREIRALDNLLCDLTSLVNRAFNQTSVRHGRLTCDPAIVGNLLSKAAYHVNALQAAIYPAHGHYRPPYIGGSGFGTPSSGYVPANPSFGYDFYRSPYGQRSTGVGHSNANGTFGRFGNNGLEFNRHGVTLNINGRQLALHNR